MSSSVFRPSPLSIGSPRTSPFRRPESPSTAKAPTPTASPTKNQNVWTPRGLPKAGDIDGTASPNSVQSPPTWKLNASHESAPKDTGFTDDSNSISKLSQPQLRELREVFQVLDRNSSQVIRKDDVADMLSNLGQTSSPSAVEAFFPHGSQSITLPQFLSTLSNLLSPLSPPQELIAAFAAFDEDDSGQVNAAELREAVLNTAPEGEGRSLSEQEVDKVMSGFLGRRTFGKKMARDETFRYQEFVATVSGSNAAKDEGEKQN